MKLKYLCSIVAIFFVILIVHGEEGISGDSSGRAVALAIDNSVSTNRSDLECKRIEMAKCFVGKFNNSADELVLFIPREYNDASPYI